MKRNPRAHPDARDEGACWSALLQSAGPACSGSATNCPPDDWIAGYAAGSLLEVERSFVEEHLAACPDCMDVAAAALSARGRAGDASRRPASRARRTTVLLIAAAALFLVLLLAPLVNEAMILEKLFDRINPPDGRLSAGAVCAVLVEEAARAGVPESLRAGLSAIPRKFKEAAAATRSAGSGGLVARPLAPLRACREVQPEFRFEVDEPPLALKVELWRRDRIVWEGVAGGGGGFERIAGCPVLERGATYHYIVKLSPAGVGAERRAGPFFFTVLTGTGVQAVERDLESIDAAGLRDSAASFYRAVVLLEHGLHGEAWQEFQASGLSQPADRVLRAAALGRADQDDAALQGKK